VSVLNCAPRLLQISVIAFTACPKIQALAATGRRCDSGRVGYCCGTRTTSSCCLVSTSCVTNPGFDTRSRYVPFGMPKNA
jgi:hypothetical protein